MDDGLPGWRSVCLCKDCWRNIAITLIDLRSPGFIE